MPTGHCHCGAIRYELRREPKWSALCLPGIADVQIATLDDPGAVSPQIHVQSAERIAWMQRAHELPAFPRYPGKS